MNAEQRDELRQYNFKNVQIQKNINFLDKPMWLPDKSNKVSEKCGIKKNNRKFEIQYDDGSGYSIYSGWLGLPNHEDVKWLNFMLYKLQTQKNQNNYTLEFQSFYEVMKEMGISTNDPHYWKSFLESLCRWRQVELEFNTGAYFLYTRKKDDKKIYASSVKKFNVIGSISLKFVNSVSKDSEPIRIEGQDYYVDKYRGQLLPATELKKHTGRLKSCSICFDPEWVEAQKKNFTRKDSILPCFYMSPMAYRLYEILSKSFHNKNIIMQKFNGKTLDRKLPKKFQSKSHRRLVIEKALKNITDNSKRKYRLEIEIRREDDLFKFIKL